MTKKECSILRGVAILCIILHNFCKRIPFAVPENEYSFSLDNVLLFWNTLQWDTIFIQFFSFWGHLGVPVFVLLSGYGLALKYDRIETLDWKDFLWRHYKKLCYPMVGGLLAYYIVRYLMSPHDYNGIQEIFPIKQFMAQLTLLINLLPEPHKLILPGPYWYFGMTMQLYVIYLIFVHKRPTAFIVIIAVATLFVCLFLQQYTSLLIWIKVNAAGWLLPFALGIIIGRSHKCCPPPIHQVRNFMRYGYHSSIQPYLLYMAFSTSCYHHLCNWYCASNSSSIFFRFRFCGQDLHVRFCHPSDSKRNELSIQSESLYGNSLICDHHPDTLLSN